MKLTKTIWLGLGLLLGLNLASQAAPAACLSARFPDYRDWGCKIPPGNFKSLPIPSYRAENQKTCDSGECATGMPRWWVSEPYINLWVADEPLSYTTSYGQRMSFRWTHRQRDQVWLDRGRATREQHISGTAHGLTRYGYELPADNNTALTNGWWHHNWWSDIVVWSETMPTNIVELNAQWQPTNAVQRFQAAWSATIHLPNGGLVRRDSTNLAPAGELKLVVLGIGGPEIPVTWTGGPPRYPTNGTFYVPETRYGFRLEYPDGSQDVYALANYYNDAFLSPNTHQYTAQFCLTERRDAQGRRFRLAYERTGGTTPNYRVRQLEDPDGRVSTYSYRGTNSADWHYLTRIEDPYGRSANFLYDLFGKLRFAGIVDAAGLTNTFAYQGNNGWITNIATPYGSTGFRYFEEQEAGATDEYTRRAVHVTEPNGGHQLYYYRHLCTNVVDSTASPVPDVPDTNFDTGANGSDHHELYYRNTFHWNQRQFAALTYGGAFYWDPPAGNLANGLSHLTANDYRKAGMKHWLLDGGDMFTLSSCVSSEREPSPDAAGTIEGLRTWYDYTGKPAAQLAGTDVLPSCVAQVLPDGTTHYTHTEYTVAGYASQSWESYTKSDGSPDTRTVLYSYGTNGMDLASIGFNGTRLLGLAYNANHTIAFATNALNELTQFGYGYNWPKLSSVTLPSGLSATLNYYASNAISANGNFLSNVIWPAIGRVVTLTHTNGLPHTVSDERGLSVTNTWDGLNRLTSTRYPDGSYTSNLFDKLDVVGTRDRLGHWTWYGYDVLQHLTSITDARSNVTALTWCDCGSLESVTDALTNRTTFYYNNQGRLTNVVFPDNRGLSYWYDAAGRLTNIVDQMTRSVKLGCNHQGLLTTVSNANGRLMSIVYDALNRPFAQTDANNVTVTNTFDLLDRLTARVWPDGFGEGYGWSANGLVSSTNRDGQVTRYTRNAAGWLAGVTNANQEVTAFGYNSLGQVTDLWDGNTNRTQWAYDVYGRATSKVNALDQEVRRWNYNANGQLTNRWTPQFGDTGYAFDAGGNLTNVAYSDATHSLALRYDALNRLTNMVDAVGTHGFSYAATGELEVEDGPWADDTVAYSYFQGLRSWMTLAEPGGGWAQTYGYDNGRRLQSVESPAGLFGYGYQAGSAASRVAYQVLPNSAWITNHFDALGRLDSTALINRWGHVLDSYAYTHDPLGLRTNVVRDLGWTTNSVSVGYDAIGQLTTWTAKESSGSARLNEQLRYAYDAAGNLRQRTNGVLVQTFSVDTLNQLASVSRTGTLTVSGATPAPATSVTVNGQAAERYGDFMFASTNHALFNGQNVFTNIATRTGATVTNTLTVNLPQSVTLQYDLNGNLTNDGLRSFQFDADNRMTAVSVSAEWRSEFTYDGFGRRRIAKDYQWQGGSWVQTNETRLVYDRALAVQERTSNNVVSVTYTRGLDLGRGLQRAGGIGGMLARSSGTDSAFYHADGAGNVTSLLDARNNVSARYLYDAFGRQVGQWGPMAEANRYRFSSKENTHGLYDFGRRYYEPNFSRFVNPDPIGERGGINLYGFVGNSPLNRVDPYGERELAEALAAAMHDAVVDFFADVFYVVLYAEDPPPPQYILTDQGIVYTAAEPVTLAGEPTTASYLLLGLPVLAPELLPFRSPVKTPCPVAARTTAQPLALGLKNAGLEGFAQARGATMATGENWQATVWEKLADPNTTVHFNLDRVNVWDGVQRAAGGVKFGPTDWELLQIKQNPQFWDTLQFWKGGQPAPNPFK